MSVSVAVGLVLAAASPARGSEAASPFGAMVEGVLRGEGEEKSAGGPAVVCGTDRSSDAVAHAPSFHIASLISGLFNHAIF